MGTIIRYCSSCEKGFAENFRFCPNCANKLSIFEMKTVSDGLISNGSKVLEEEIKESLRENREAEKKTKKSERKAPPVMTGSSINKNKTKAVKESIVKTVVPESNNVKFSADKGIAEIKKHIEKSVDFIAPPVVSKKGYNGNNNEVNSLDEDDYELTVIQEKGLKTRNSLLIGASVLVLAVIIGSLGYSLFNYLPLVAAIGDDEIILTFPDITPVDIEEEQPDKKANDKEGGGGGGGGKERKSPASQGQLPSQKRKKTTPPVPMETMENPGIAVVNQTEGDIKRDQRDRAGLPSGLTGMISSGTGAGDGIGSGRGGGVGSGIGTGEGSGIGTGSGGGRGNTRGSGVGRSAVKGPSAPLRILEKPRAGYTDQARNNNVQGVVMLRVTFLSSGRIGSISTLKGLPHGLTSKAIEAARRIRFKPKLVNGNPLNVTKRIRYNFTIY